MSESRDVFISMRVTEEEREAIRKAARALRRTSSDVLRVAVLGVASEVLKARSGPDERGR